ncbi:MAG TPA: permease, partial [Sedimentisphaerales bacterium]|nr:permease [Sedimentisphaerales bacterium]
MWATITPILLDFWGTVVRMAPFLLFGFAVAGVLSIIISRRFVETHLGGKGLFSVVKASLIGVPMPLCSCGVIPVATSLRRHGASKGATISFLISTPSTGIDSFFVTLGLLGWVMAIFRPIVAFISGVIGGGLADLSDRSAPVEKRPKCDGDCCDEVPKQNRLVRALRHSFVTLPRDIGRPLLLGITIAALIGAFMPDDFFQKHLPPGILSMLVMMLIGIPMYVCASASVPIAAALIAKGISPGAALVFLIVG